MSFIGPDTRTPPPRATRPGSAPIRTIQQRKVAENARCKLRVTRHTPQEQLENMRLVLVQQRLGGSGGAGGEMSQLSNVPLAIGGFDANEVAKTAMTVPIMTAALLLLCCV